MNPGRALDRLHRTWFGPTPSDGVPEEARRYWFDHDPELDRQLEHEFGSLHHRMTEQKAVDRVESSDPSPRRMLSLIVLLDQVSRNLHRNSPKAYQQDDQARALARSMVESGTDRELISVERVFVYMPFEHSERLADQERSVALFERLLEEAPEDWKEQATEFLDYARRHYEVIERFGRFPHRNEILGRESTPEEREYLETAGSGF